MAVLENIEPIRVFHYFEEIAKIPHGSRNTKQISDYLVEFAKKHELRFIQDSLNNVIIFKDAAQGYENAPTVILQGHMDMVCEKKPDLPMDFTKDGLRLKVEGDFLKAEGTTLGGDDGIAVAYALAILEDKMMHHPALEVVITVDEEIGLLGAGGIDTSSLRGTYFLNLDSDEEGYLWCGCAGGMTTVSELPVRYVEEKNNRYEIHINGLTGGHSGAEIDKNRANASIVMGRFLFELRKHLDYMLSELEGGSKDNAITRESRAMILMEDAKEGELHAFAKEFQCVLRREYSGSDEGITVNVTALGEGVEPALHPVSLEKVIFYLRNIPFGVQKMNGVIPDLVETSTNPGILKLTPECLSISSSVRSSYASAKNALADKIQYLTEFLGGEFRIEGDYPAWEYRKDSPLRKLMIKVYEDMFHSKPEVKIIHAGLECGLFYEKLPGLDCISYGPDMKNIHTTEEMLSITSTKRMWDYTCEILKRIQ